MQRYAVVEASEQIHRLVGPFEDRQSAEEYIHGEYDHGSVAGHLIVPLGHPSESPVQPEGRWQ